jgi:hypothetical protein
MLFNDNDGTTRGPYLFCSVNAKDMATIFSVGQRNLSRDLDMVTTGPQGKPVVLQDTLVGPGKAGTPVDYLAEVTAHSA